MNSKELLEFAESLGIQYKLLEDDYYFYLPDGMVDGDFDNHTDDDEDKQPVFFVWRHLTKEVVLTLHISVDEEFNILYNDSYISESMDEVKKNVATDIGNLFQDLPTNLPTKK